MIIECTNCEQEFNKKPSEMSGSGNNFCSRKCMGEFKTKKVEVPCGTCGNPVSRTPAQIRKSKTGHVYCSKSCSAVASNGGNSKNYKGGTTTYRKRAIEKYGELCNRCGYIEVPSILQVHHKDANRSNNSIDNLEVLCPNCHAMTPTFRARNKTSARDR